MYRLTTRLAGFCETNAHTLLILTSCPVTPGFCTHSRAMCRETSFILPSPRDLGSAPLEVAMRSTANQFDVIYKAINSGVAKPSVVDFGQMRTPECELDGLPALVEVREPTAGADYAVPRTNEQALRGCA